MSDLNVPFNKHGLKDSEIASLRKGVFHLRLHTFLALPLTSLPGNFQTVADLLLTPTQDIAKRCRVSPLEVKRIVDIVLSATTPPKLERLDNCSRQDEVFTTGDKTLDVALGGGIRTGMVWEVVGERYVSSSQKATTYCIAYSPFQRCRKNPICPAIIFICPSTARVGGPGCFHLLLDNIFEATYCTASPDF